MSALDKAIDGLEWWMKEYCHPDLAAEASDLMQPARAELAALRQRCEELVDKRGTAAILEVAQRLLEYRQLQALKERPKP